MPQDPVRDWHALTTTEVAAFVERDPVVVWPLGAIEQHGPHLPLSTDVDIAQGLVADALRRLPADVPAGRLPAQALGSSREHERFPGTLSLDARVLGAIVSDVGAGLARSGVRRLVLANAHGGNRGVIADAALELREAYGLLVVTVNYGFFPRPPDVALPESEWRHGLHGGAIETAMMLHLRPGQVRREAMGTAPSLGAELESAGRRLGPEDAAASFAWLAGDLHPSGVTGDATLATSVLGERLVAHYGAQLAGVIADAHAFPLDRLS